MKMNHRGLEIDWYLKNGKYGKSRITKDSNGNEYVIGDYSWNAINPNKKETIENRMFFNVSSNKEQIECLQCS